MTQEQFAQKFGEERKRADAWFAALDAARPSAKYVLEFVQLFPEAKVNYRYFTRSGEPGYDVSVDLHGRYELAMQLPVNFSSSGAEVVGYGDPKFYLVEVEKIEWSKGGSPSVWYNPSGERHFGGAEWQKIFTNGGSFEAIGYSMITNQPLAGFNERKAPRQQ